MRDLEVVRVNRGGAVVEELGTIPFEGIPRYGDLVLLEDERFTVVAVVWLRPPLGAGLEPVVYLQRGLYGLERVTLGRRRSS